MPKGMAFFIYALNISDIEAELSVHKMAGAILNDL
jgi:hypothetical protein